MENEENVNPEGESQSEENTDGVQQGDAPLGEQTGTESEVAQASDSDSTVASEEGVEPHAATSTFDQRQ